MGKRLAEILLCCEQIDSSRKPRHEKTVLPPARTTQSVEEHDALLRDAGDAWALRGMVSRAVMGTDRIRGTDADGVVRHLRRGGRFPSCFGRGKTEEKEEESPFAAFATEMKSIKHHEGRILNYFTSRSTNAAAESFNAKIKGFRALVRGVTDKKFFLFRIAKIYA